MSNSKLASLFQGGNAQQATDAQKKSFYVESMRKNRIKELREERGWSTYRLAEETGLSQPYILRLERKDPDDIKPRLIKKLAAAFDVTPDQVVEDSDKTRFADNTTLRSSARDYYSLSDEALSVLQHKLVPEIMGIFYTVWRNSHFKDTIKVDELSHLTARLVMEIRRENKEPTLSELKDRVEKMLAAFYRTFKKG